MLEDDTVLIRNNVKIFGKGTRPMLFAHGFGCDHHMWRFITPAFEDDYQVILFDYVGAGGSDKSYYNAERYASLEGYSQDIIEICDALKLRNTIFVGHSVSCMIGLLAAINEPSYFSDLVMIGPSPCYINNDEYFGGFSKMDIENLLVTMEKNYVGWANFMGPSIMGNSDRPELGAELTESFCSTDPVIAKQFARATFFADNRNDLANSPVPSLILQCSDDIIAPGKVGKYISERMPHSTLSLMEATGHCPHVSAPEETIQEIKAYLLARENDSRP